MVGFGTPEDDQREERGQDESRLLIPRRNGSSYRESAAYQPSTGAFGLSGFDKAKQGEHGGEATGGIHERLAVKEDEQVLQAQKHGTKDGQPQTRRFKQRPKQCPHGQEPKDYAHQSCLFGTHSKEAEVEFVNEVERRGEQHVVEPIQTFLAKERHVLGVHRVVAFVCQLPQRKVDPEGVVGSKVVNPEPHHKQASQCKQDFEGSCRHEFRERTSEGLKLSLRLRHSALPTRARYPSWISDVTQLPTALHWDSACRSALGQHFSPINA